MLDSGLGSEVLFACGRLLFDLQRVPARVVDSNADPDATLVHGDFGPNNTLFDAEGTTAVLLADWEWMHVGEPVTDLAWCEWIVRTHHRDRTGALGALFDGYGDRPDWSARKQAMLDRCHQHLVWARSWENRRAEVWVERITNVSTWRELP
ncbi:MAG: phosphotransferase [Nocardioidaceae bacterium]|nr:phosphotransferase [Nocardioidaceae bacterium]